MKVFINSLIHFLISLTVVSVCAQQQGSALEYEVNISTPASPTAFQFSTYGNLPLNGSSGGFSYTLPIYEIKTGEINMPISLDYFSNGVEVNTLSGSVGTDWVLRAGGVITRKINDYPDESSIRWYPEWAESSTHRDSIYDSWRIVNYDTEQDWFTFNVNGISGNFFFDKNLEIHYLSDQCLKINKQLNSEGFLTGFTIFDDKGTKYEFGNGENFVESTSLLPECDMGTSARNTGWYLQKITSTTGRQILFEYIVSQLEYTTDYSVTYNRWGNCPAPALISAQHNIRVCRNRVSTDGKLISKIKFDSTLENNVVVYKSSVNFLYEGNRADGGDKYLKDIEIKHGTNLINSASLTYEMVPGSSVYLPSFLQNDTALLNRLFLTNVTFKGNQTGTNFQNYLFDYHSKNLVATRLSLARDIYGYSNGGINIDEFWSTRLNDQFGIQQYTQGLATADFEVNPDRVYYGMLKKIKYPTGGETQISYEVNKDNEIVEEPVYLNQQLNVYKPSCSMPTVTQSFTFNSNGSNILLDGVITPLPGNCNPVTFQIKFFKNSSTTPFLTLNEGNSGSIFTNTGIPCVGNFVGVNYNHQPICTEAGNSYTIQVSLIGGTASIQLNVRHNMTLQMVEHIIYGAGARVSELVDLAENGSNNKRKYFYNSFDAFLVNSQSNNSTMQHRYEPKLYKEDNNTWYWCPMISNPNCLQGWSLNTQYNLSLFSNAINTNNQSRQGINYNIISEIFYNGAQITGAKEKTFCNNPLSPAYPYYNPDIYGSNPSNLGDIYKDKIQIEKTLEANGALRKKVTTIYQNFGEGHLSSTAVRRNWSIYWEEDFLAKFLPLEGPCGPEPQYLVPLPNYTLWNYRNYFGNVRPVSSEIVEYFTSLPVTIMTNYEYGVGPYFLPSRINSQDSKGITLATEYRYPFDLTAIEQSAFMQQLVSDFRVGDPVISSSFHGTEKVSENHVKFGQSTATANKILPIELFHRKGSGLIDINTTTDRRSLITKYDSNGNILEYKKDNGAFNCLIWGYFDSKIIAEIQNSTYASISSSLITTAKNESNDNDEIGLLSALSAIRNAIPAAMVTSYTHKPGVGVSTVTDPKADKIVNEYDDFGRLKAVKDKQGNYLSENEYHFRP